MRFFFEQYDDHVEILPTLTVGNVTCGNCDQVHGVSVSISWLLWSFGIAFTQNDE